MALCSGTVADGSGLVTSSPGRFDFTLQGIDAVGNAAERRSTYGVSYDIYPLYDQQRALGRAGATVPIRLALCGADGTNVSDPHVTVTALDVDGASLTEPRGGANSDGVVVPSRSRARSMAARPSKS